MEAGDDSEEEEHGNQTDDDSEESSSEDGEEDTDPGPWQNTDEWAHVPNGREVKTKGMIAHKFLTEVGWEVGVVKKKSAGRWDVKYPSETVLYPHDLNLCDYGVDKYWVLVTKQK